MKHIGIVDITTIGACLCANEIVAFAAKNDSSGKHPEFTMHSFSFDQYKKLIFNKDWINLAEKICQSIKLLEKIGADFIIIPSNTPHFAIDLIEIKSSLKVINLLKIVVDQCLRKGYKNILILGTKTTMKDGLYDQILNSNNINTIIPNDDLCDRIEHLIINEIIPSKINSTTVENIQQSIKQYQCDAIILGCTELPILYNENNLGKPVIDTTRLLAHYAYTFAVQDHPLS